MSSVLEIAKSINKAWKSDVITSADLIPECERFSMGTLSADYALYGGLPEGKLSVYAGESGSGKSLLAVLAMSQYQKKHPEKTNIYVDAEETLRGQLDWFAQMTDLDLDPEKFVRYDCAGKSAEEIFDDLIKLQAAENIGMIIIDSAPMLLSQADIDNEIAKDNGQRASIAKSMGKFLKFMIPAIAKASNPLIIINHTRVAGTTFTGAKIFTEPCGYALNYYPTTKVRFAVRKFTKGDKLDIAASQSDATDGFCVTFSVTKNRLGALNRSGAKIVFRYDSGVDKITDLFEIITKREIARLEGNTWFLENPITKEPYLDEFGNPLKFGSKAKLFAYLQENPEFTAQYEKVVSDYINQAKRDMSLIDEEDLAAIIEAEKGVEESIKNYKEYEEDTSSKDESIDSEVLDTLKDDQYPSTKDEDDTNDPI